MFELVNLLSIDAMVEMFFVLVAQSLNCPILANALATKEAKANVKAHIADMVSVAKGEDDARDLYSLSTYAMAQSFVDVFSYDSLGSQNDDVYDAAKRAYKGYLDMLHEHRMWFL